MAWATKLRQTEDVQQLSLANCCLVLCPLFSSSTLAFSIAGGAYFYNSLSNSMDHELKVVGSQIGHAIDISGSKPTFRDWLRVVETEPARSVMAMQLFR
jgi:hypothetical protein